MKKTLVYNLYINEKFENKGIYKIHYECLKYYMHIFDEAIFQLNVDNLSDTKLINKGLNWISEISQNISFTVKVKKNTLPYEGKTLLEEIINKRHDMEGMVFFAHSKGSTRLDLDFKEIFQEEMGTINEMSLVCWIFALYFYSLNFIDEAEGLLYGRQRPSELFYGPLLTQLKDPSSSPMFRMNKGNCFYQGTFFWINIEKFTNYMDRGVIKVPLMDDRYWAEMLPGAVGGRYLFGDGCSSHNDVAINDEFNLYKMNKKEWELLTSILGDENEFWNFYQKLTENIFS
jgi:hypothetical protein